MLSDEEKKAYDKAYNKEYYAKNKEKYQAYREQHREKRNEALKKYRLENKSKTKAAAKKYDREYYLKNKQRILEKCVDYYVENKEKIAAYKREYAVKNKDKIAEQRRKYRIENKDKISERRRASWYNTLYAIKSRSSRKGLPFNLTKEYLDAITPTHCPVLGYELVRNHRGKSSAYNSMSVDRIVPSKGYTIGNVQVISNKANTMKHNATPEELLMFANWIFNTHKELTC
jgi:hypothetical protein